MAAFVGQTILARVSDLEDPFGYPLIEPEVSINLLKPDGTTEVGTVTSENPVYWAEFEGTDPGLHTILAEATSGGGTWKARSTLYIRPA